MTELELRQAGFLKELQGRVDQLERIIKTREMMLKGKAVENAELAAELANSNRLLENAKRVFRERENDSSIARFARIREKHRAGVQRELRLGGALEEAQREIESLKHENYHEHELAERRLREILLTAAQREDLKAKVESLEVQLNDAHNEIKDLKRKAVDRVRQAKDQHTITWQSGRIHELLEETEELKKQIYHAKAALEGRTEVVDVPK